MKLPGRLIRRPFPIVFGVLLLAAFVVALGHTMGPGQDFHYHTMAARIAARTWIGDPAFDALYAKVNPLDGNTLFYVLAFPFELVLSPLDAMRLSMALLYFVGYPVGCAVALHLLGRSPWGAVLAIPLAYCNAWSTGGFMPFCTSASLFVLAVALLTRALEHGQTLTRRQMIASAAVVALLFFAHAHVYAWTIFLFGVFTAGTIASRLAVGALRGIESAWHDVVRTGGRMLAIVGPSLLFFGWWSLRMRQTGSAPTTFSDDSFHDRIYRAHTMVALTKGTYEFLYIGALAIVILAGMLLAGRPKRPRAPLVETAFLVTALAYVLLPWGMNGQGIAPRKFEMAMWLVPLVVYPYAAGRGALARHAAIVAAVVTLAVARLSMVSTALGELDREYAGLFDLLKSCPPAIGRDGRRAEIAYAAENVYSDSFFSATFFHAHETLAVTCGLDAPVYDSRTYPFNLVPLRYKNGPPALPTRIFEDRRWFAKSGLWDDFEYVLVRGYPPTPEEAAEIAAHAHAFASSREWTLYRRNR